MTWLFEMQGVCFTYPGGITALRGLSLQVPARRKVVFLGTNGSGKSTLFLHLNGILQPQRGTILFRGEPITYTRSSLRELRRRVGMVFQDPDAQLFAGTVFQEVSFGPMNLALSQEEVRRRVENALAMMAIETLRDRPIHFLSYGEKRRVAIADVLAMEAEVILFDEPTAYLDTKGMMDLLEIIEGLYRHGKEILLATHDVDFAYAFADWVVVLEKGRVLAEGFPEEVFATIPVLSQGNLRRPLLFEIAAILRERGYINGCIPRRVDMLVEALQRRSEAQ
ncbi:MAG: energy-coupling factor ABC transporter ATP-binding protein [Candidatus Caldatribacteriaceae bacterium]